MPSDSEVPALAAVAAYFPGVAAGPCLGAEASTVGAAIALKGPGVAVGVAEGDERAPRLNVNVAGLHTVLDEFSPRGLDIGNDAS